MRPITPENMPVRERIAPPPDDRDIELDVTDLREADPRLRSELSGVIEYDRHQTERRFRRRPSVILLVPGEHRPAPPRPLAPPSPPRLTRQRRRPHG